MIIDNIVKLEYRGHSRNQFGLCGQVTHIHMYTGSTELKYVVKGLEKLAFIYRWPLYTGGHCSMFYCTLIMALI